MKKTTMIFFIVMSLSLLLTSSSQAHMLWLLVNNATPQAGDKVQVEVGWGHKFPKDEDIQEERLGAIKAIGPDGQELPLKKLSTTQYEFSPPTKGTYLLAAQVTPGFLTRTKDGFKLHSKQGLTDVVNCFRFDMAAKTLVYVGGGRHEVRRRAHSSLEIIPLLPTHTLKPGATLPVQVLFQGQPLAEVEIKAAHEKPADPEKPLVSVGRTDARGQLQINLDKPGRWLLVAAHKTPYPNPEECDEHFYNASLTWRVR